MVRLKPAVNAAILLTNYNEWGSLELTLDSILHGDSSVDDIIIIDDGSTHECGYKAQLPNTVRIIRHSTRIGVGFSRNEASRLSQSDVLGFFDAHQRIEPLSISKCAALAVERQSIVCPDVSGLEEETRLHGSFFNLTRGEHQFSSIWIDRKPVGPITQVTSVRAPAYFFPRNLYPQLAWSSLLGGWGGSEASISVKAFFCGIKILHLCGPLIRHQFKTKFHYDVGWQEVWRNHAIIARICFTDRTWNRFWLPKVFGPHLAQSVLDELESDEIRAEQMEFAQYKVRPDEEFWTHLLFRKVPAELL